MFEQLEEVESAFQEIEKKLTLPETIANQAVFQKLSREHKRLGELVSTYREYRHLCATLESNQQIIRLESGELRELAIEENAELGLKIPPIEQKLRVLLLPKDPNDDKNILLEIRAGAGGDEAGIFVGDLLRMYPRFAEKKAWSVELMSESTNDVGGFREVVLMI